MISALTKLYRWRYPVAIVITGLTYLARSGSQPILGGRSQVVLFMLVIMLSALNGGFGPGLLATALSITLAPFAIFEPRGLPALAETANLLTLGLFALVGVSISAVSGAMRNTRRRLEAISRSADEQNLKLKEEIAQRGRIASVLREGEERFKAFMDRCPAIAFIKDENGRYVYANKTWENIFALNWRGKTDAEIWPRDNMARFDDSDRRALEAGQASESFETLLDKNGRPQDWWMLKFPIVDATGKRSLGGIAMEVTEQKRQQSGLEEAHIALTKAMPGTARLDAEGHYLAVNDIYAGMLGYDATELIGIDWSRTIHEVDRPRALAAYERMSEVDKAEFDACAVRKDGSTFFKQVLMVKIVDDDGRHIGHHCFMRDISERKQAENLLRQAHDALERRVEARTAQLAEAVASLTKTEDRLRQAVDVADIGIFERDHVVDEVYYSPTLRRIIDLPEDWQGSVGDVLSRIYSDDREVVNLARRRAHDPAGDGRLLYECRVVRRDGSIGWILNRGETIFAGTGAGRRPVRTVGAVLDITERKRSEESLRASEDRVQHALAVGHMGTWERDLRTGEVTWDDRVYEMYGIAKGVAISRDFFMAHVHPADLPVMEEAISRSEREPQGYRCEFRFLRPDGKMIWLLSHRGLRRDRDGTPTHIAGINFDITQTKATEEALRNLNEQLDQRVAQRTRELAGSRAALRALVAELTMTEERERRRLAVALHDTLAQSLAVMNLYLWRVRELLGDQANGARFKEVLGNLDSTVDDSIKYTRSLIADLSPPVLYDLGLPAGFRWLGGQMAQHGLRVEVDGPADGLPLAQDDAVFLFQCARELLWNVVKHGATDRATLTYGRDGDRVSLTVADKGKGFARQPAGADGEGRSHFGLFSIRERVELRGGAVEIDSTPGAGTSVSIVLPMDRKEAALAKIVEPVLLPGAMAPVIEHAIKILLVDDHKMVRQGLRRVLEEQGSFTVVGEAGDGAEAVVLARALDPQVVIMDVNMPTMNGIEATEKIIHDRPSTIVIGLSFRATESSVVRAMQAAGAVTCLAKERAVEDVGLAILDAVAERGAAAH